MTSPRTITRQQVCDEPHVVWNTFVNLLANANYDELSEIQRDAFLVFWYEHEVQNGGHLQFLENRGTQRVHKTIEALKKLCADGQSRVLANARVVFEAKRREKIVSVEEYVRTASGGEFDQIDAAFHTCQPTLTTVLEKFLERHQSQFVIVEAQEIETHEATERTQMKHG